MQLPVILQLKTNDREIVSNREVDPLTKPLTVDLGIDLICDEPLMGMAGL